MKRILVRAPNWIGDQVMAWSFFRRLREMNPQAWIAVICVPWVKDIQFQSEVDEVFVLPRSKNKTRRFYELIQFGRTIRGRGPWDLGISLPNSFGSAFLLKTAGCQSIRGYDTDLRSFFLSDSRKWNPSPQIHRALSYVRLADDFESFDLTQDELPLKGFDSIQSWPEAKAFSPPDSKYFVLAPGANAPSRQWSEKQFYDLALQIRELHGFEIVVVGGPKELEIANIWRTRGLDFLDYCGKGTVAQLWRIFQNAQFTVCNESGLAHVASFCGSSTWIVCGAANPIRTKPTGPGRVEVVTNAIECWPCEKNVCRFQGDQMNACLKGITPEQVYDQMKIKNERSFRS